MHMSAYANIKHAKIIMLWLHGAKAILDAHLLLFQYSIRVYVLFLSLFLVFDESDHEERRQEAASREAGSNNDAGVCL